MFFVGVCALIYKEPALAGNKKSEGGHRYMIVVIVVLALAMLGIGAAGYFLARKVNSDPVDYAAKIDKEKLAEWEDAAKNFDGAKTQRESCESSEAWQAAHDVGVRARQAFPGGLVVKTGLQSLDDYKSFDAKKWLRANSDSEEAARWLRLSEQALSAWRELRHDIDCAAVMVSDEADPKAKKAGIKELEDALMHLSGQLVVQYSFTDAASGKSYVNTQAVPARFLAKIMGNPDYECEDIMARHAFLFERGFRCRRCGRSPLSGAYLMPGDGPTGRECLCENCRRPD
ncbi:MAG: hypothetical protein NC311_13610 [Muribaculaceae bacterium]|nr:hypothetical protein [Muribaculaceae bacterium]